MLTKDDKKLLLDNFVTKSEFNNRIDQLEEKMVTKEDMKRVGDLTDQVLKELKDMRQEQIMH